MGLFNRNNNRQNNAPSGMVSPQEFYTLCVKDYHSRAKALGQANRDVIFIPELMNYGQQAVIWFLSNDDLQSQIEDPVDYYYIAVDTAIRCGILFGLKWHEDYAGLQRPGYVEQVMSTGPSTLTKSIIQKDLGLSDKGFSEFCSKIYMRWAELHRPYWELNNPSRYTMFATLAAFQLGVSMILCKYGF